MSKVNNGEKTTVPATTFSTDLLLAAQKELIAKSIHNRGEVSAAEQVAMIVLVEGMNELVKNEKVREEIRVYEEQLSLL